MSTTVLWKSANLNSSDWAGKMMCSQKRDTQNDMAGIRGSIEEVVSAMHTG